MTIIDGGEGDTIAAYQPTARKLVIVTMNYGIAQTITYNLSNFYQAAGPIRRWMTTTGTGFQYAQLSGPLVSNKSFRSSFPTSTIQTFEIQNVDLYPPPPLNVKQITGSGQIDISWPVTADGFNLYESASLSDPGPWQQVTNTPEAGNGNYHVVLPTGGSNQQFFRLSNP